MNEKSDKLYKAIQDCGYTVVDEKILNLFFDRTIAPLEPEHTYLKDTNFSSIEVIKEYIEEKDIHIKSSTQENVLLEVFDAEKICEEEYLTVDLVYIDKDAFFSKYWFREWIEYFTQANWVKPLKKEVI